MHQAVKASGERANCRPIGRVAGLLQLSAYFDKASGADQAGGALELVAGRANEIGLRTAHSRANFGDIWNCGPGEIPDQFADNIPDIADRLPPESRVPSRW